MWTRNSRFFSKLSSLRDLLKRTRLHCELIYHNFFTVRVYKFLWTVYIKNRPKHLKKVKNVFVLGKMESFDKKTILYICKTLCEHFGQNSTSDGLDLLNTLITNYAFRLFWSTMAGSKFGQSHRFVCVLSGIIENGNCLLPSDWNKRHFLKICMNSHLWNRSNRKPFFFYSSSSSSLSYVPLFAYVVSYHGYVLNTYEKVHRLVNLRDVFYQIVRVS